MPLRVVLDSNCFHRDTFELLANSPMRSLCRRGSVVAIYPDVVIKEVVRAYGRERRREALLQQWIPFVRETYGELKDDLVTVWHSEVIQNLGRKANPNLSPNSIRQIFENIGRAPLDGSWQIWDEVQPDLDLEDQSRDAVHELFKATRVEWKSVRHLASLYLAAAGAARLTGHYEDAVDYLGRTILTTRLKSSNPNAIAMRWSSAKSRYPYYTESMRGFVYSMIEPAARPNTALDRNALADVKVMVHLHDAHVVVSNEAKFFARAFDALWRPRGKVLMSVEQFVGHLKKMA